MSKPKNKSESANNYVKTFRDGAIAASIFRETAADGHTYLDFKISRSWKSPSGNRQGYSDKFYPRNADAICIVTKQAADWINEFPEAADEGWQPAPQAVAA